MTDTDPKDGQIQADHSSNVSRRTVVTGLGAAVMVAGCETILPAPGPKGPPNIVFIMADDLGYADLSCYGRRDYETPNIDRLAKQGMRFTSAYANSPVCSATRTALITGNYQYREAVGLEEPLTRRNVGLTPNKPTMPSRMKELGYETALVGKWHLGRLPTYGPLQSGYDHFWGFRGGGVDYFSHSFGGRRDTWDGDTPVEAVGYLTDLLGDRAIEQIEDFATRDKPFLLSLHFSAPHWPWEGAEDGQAESDRLTPMRNPLSMLHFDGGNLKTYADMVTRLDVQVGRVMETLKRLDMDDNTIVVFTSDNGGERFSDNWPFTGRKTELLEGGIRVPTIVRWPDRVQAGSESDVPLMSMDWLPTFVEAASPTASLEAHDGVSLINLFETGNLPERPLYWRFNIHDQRAIRVGKWKYLQIAGNEFLFDVVADPLERGNLKAREPEIFAGLKSQYEAWNSTMLPYDAQAFSHGINGEELADHFGVERSAATRGGPE